jgi:peptidoglycan hydrolase-like protein with peptidoglycan-binding domain
LVEPSSDPQAPGTDSRADRLASERGSKRRTWIASSVAALVLIGCAVAVYVFAFSDEEKMAASVQAEGNVAAPPETKAKPKPTTTTTLAPTTTTTTVPPVKQPKNADMPDVGGGLGQGSSGPLVQLYEMRMKALKFDPGPVDGVYDDKTYHAVVAVQKYFGKERTGRINADVQAALSKFYYVAAEPKSEANRVEIDLDRQIIQLFKNGQVELIVDTSTGNGEHFCGGVDGCQYAITPTGHFKFYSLYRGWQKGKLGTMYNPYYFNGSIAIHGLDSVPTYPASHGCARIPNWVADYFHTLVHDGMSVFVVGTPKQAGSGYVGPARNSPAPQATTPPPTTAAPVNPVAVPTTAKPTPTTTKKPPATTPTTKVQVD